MFRLKSPFKQIIARVEQAEDRLARRRPELLELLGQRLVEFTTESLEIRSKGGTAAGIAWQPLTPKYRRQKQAQGQTGGIGLASGELFQSLEAKGAGVQFSAAHSPHFSRRRPLLPETLPEEWEAGLAQEAETWATEILTETLEEI